MLAMELAQRTVYMTLSTPAEQIPNPRGHRALRHVVCRRLAAAHRLRQPPRVKPAACCPGVARALHQANLWLLLGQCHVHRVHDSGSRAHANLPHEIGIRPLGASEQHGGTHQAELVDSSPVLLIMMHM